MLLADVVQASAAVSATRSRLAKVETLAAVLRAAAESGAAESSAAELGGDR